MRRPANPFKPKPYKNPFAAKPLRGSKMPSPPGPRDPGNERIICEAIRRKVLIGFRYKPTDMTERVARPHVLWETEKGITCAFVLQVVDEAGRSESTPHNFNPYEMSGLRIIDEAWSVDAAFKRHSYKNVICIVGF